MSFRLVLLSAVLIVSAACSDSGDAVIAPTPVPAPAPAPAPVPPTGQTASVSIPVGAAALGPRAFVPADLTIDVGTRVTWTNNDSVTHTSTSDSPRWNSTNVAPGGQFSVTFDSAGTFPYHCAIHPDMVARVIVR
jgi:plastocyanin